MDEQLFANSGSVEKTEGDMNHPGVISEFSADKAPLYAALLQGTPTGGTVAAIEPLYQAPLQDASMGAINEPDKIVQNAQLDEAIVYEAPLEQTIVFDEPMGETNNVEADEFIAPQTLTHANAVLSDALLDRAEAEHLRLRWSEIQGKFVDEPRSAVQQADALVLDVIEKITQVFTSEHSALEDQWKQGNNVSTEDLRKALQHYRSFFNRLVLRAE